MADLHRFLICNILEWVLVLEPGEEFVPLPEFLRFIERFIHPLPSLIRVLEYMIVNL